MLKRQNLRWAAVLFRDGGGISGNKKKSKTAKEKMLERYFFETLILAKSFAIKAAARSSFVTLFYVVSLFASPKSHIINCCKSSAFVRLTPKRSEYRFDTFEIIFHSIPLR